MYDQVINAKHLAPSLRNSQQAIIQKITES
jgi:hypothetical protein